MVSSLSPFGCSTALGGEWILARSDGDPEAKRVMFAAVSTSAVVLRLVGLAQPGNKVAEQINKELLTALLITLMPAGSTRQDFGVHLMLAWLPPMVF